MSSGPAVLGLHRGRTNSTFLLKQPNSLEVDCAALRKTRSEENMGQLAPRIVIGEVTRHTVTQYDGCL